MLFLGGGVRSPGLCANVANLLLARRPLAPANWRGGGPGADDAASFATYYGKLGLSFSAARCASFWRRHHRRRTALIPEGCCPAVPSARLRVVSSARARPFSRSSLGSRPRGGDALLAPEAMGPTC